ncbi:MAG: hypothetical protein LC789_11735 [Actinobacteria bacterium]|nr:hypothetical protein [Actinomycetota bacterium]
MLVGLVAGAGSAAALFATYWDDSWHTDRGRDEFAIPPHLLLYGGVLVAALAVAAWGLLAWQRAGWGASGVRAVLAQPALLLAGIGGAATLLSGPADAAWHDSFGRDAVLWSPPHLTAVLGTLALSVGLLAGLRLADGRGAGAARVLAAAGVVGTLQVPVLEYDSDVPQFSVVWFLPVAALGACAALALLDDLLPDRAVALRAAAVYTGLRAATVGGLALLGFSLTAVPPVLAVFALDALLRSRPLAQRLVAAGAAAPLVWWPFLQAQSGVAAAVPASRLPAAVALGAAAGVLVAVAHGDLRVAPRTAGRAAAAVLVVAAALALAGPPQRAWAHDPGQGEQVRDGLLTVERDGEGAARLAMALTGPCKGVTARRTVARRAGQTRTGRLTAADTGGGCRLAGTVAGLGPGRWFVYAEASDPSVGTLEAWLPTQAGRTASDIRPLYAPPQPPGDGARDAAGAGLLAVAAGLVVACLRLARRSRLPVA